MKALLRGFLTGFGFALGASIAGTLIGYSIGKIGESSLKRLLSPEHADQDQDGEPEWHKGCSWCWRTTWHEGDGPTGDGGEMWAQKNNSNVKNASESSGDSNISPHTERKSTQHKSHYVAAEEPCPAHFGSLQCSLSKGHTKPVDHWNGPTGTMFKVSVDEPEEEGDGGDYDKALDRHDNA